MDKLWAMQVFIQVVQARNYTHASTVVQLSVGQISRTIQALERHLGGTLLKRTTRTVAVTELGAAYYARCLHILNEVQSIENDLGASITAYQGRIRVSMPGLIAKETVIPNLATFHAAYPDIEVQIVIDEFQGELSTKGLDCGLYIGEVKSEGLIAKMLCQYNRITCAAPAYLEKYGEPSSIEDLIDHHGVGYVTHTGRTRDWDFDLDKQSVSVKFKSWVLVDDADAYVSCGVAGLGLIQSSNLLLESHLRTGRLREVLTKFPSAPRSLSVVYGSDRHRSKRLRVFIDWLAELYVKNPS